MPGSGRWGRSGSGELGSAAGGRTTRHLCRLHKVPSEPNRWTQHWILPRHWFRHTSSGFDNTSGSEIDPAGPEHANAGRNDPGQRTGAVIRPSRCIPKVESSVFTPCIGLRAERIDVKARSRTNRAVQCQNARQAHNPFFIACRKMRRTGHRSLPGATCGRGPDTQNRRERWPHPSRRPPTHLPKPRPQG